MKMIWAIFSGDVRNLFRNVIAAIVIMGLMLVPPLYAWFTTLGFWDPYSNTGNIKVAVASLDEGYKSDLLPSSINAGESVISALRANDQFDWQFVSEDEALDGVDSGKYYAALIIPKDFSANLMTVFSGDAKESSISYYSNEKENAIAQRVTSTGASTLQETVDETFTKTVATVALDTTSSLSSFMDGEGILAYGQMLNGRIDSAVNELTSAANQANAYADLMGTTDSLVGASASILEEAGQSPDRLAPLLADGQQSLQDAQEGLYEVTQSADAALAQADASFDVVAQATNQAFDQAEQDPAAAAALLTQCQQDVGTLAEAYHQVADTLTSLAPGSESAASAAAVGSALDTLEHSLGTAAETAGASTGSIDDAKQQVDEALAQARSALDDCKDLYSTELQDQLSALTSHLESVSSDTLALGDGLKTTASELGEATGSLSSSLQEAETSLRLAAQALQEAATQLQEAQADLQGALDRQDIDEIRRIVGNNPDAVAAFLAAPTKLDRHAVYPMANNGSAMSPFYTSLCLWIGAIFMVALMSVSLSPARQHELAAKFGRKPTNAEAYLGRYGVFALLGVAQALIVGLGNVFFLGVECEHFWLYLLACVVAALVFTNLVYTLTVSFGNIGKALAIIGLVLQLGGAGGLMPVQMSAPFFQAIYPWLPFAHSMEALQGAMAGIYGNHYLVSLAMLLAFLIPSFILGLVLRRPVIRLNNWVLAKLDETKFL